MLRTILVPQPSLVGLMVGIWLTGLTTLASAQVEDQTGQPARESQEKEAQQSGDDQGDSKTEADPMSTKTENQGPFKYKIGDDNKDLRRLMPEHEVWFDVKQKIVVANCEVVLNRGPLEMFACPPGTKEHESILRVKSAAFVIHAGLLAVGAKNGNPVEFVPEYKPASGTIIDLYVVWEQEGKQQWAKAQDWVLNSKSQKPMDTHWVFAGSGYWINPDTNTRHYLAESGELICVSNFSTATLDIPVESSQANEGLLFEANPEKIPPKGTAVKLVLVPRQEKKDSEKKDP